MLRRLIEYFDLNRRERYGTLAMLGIILLLVVYRYTAAFILQPPLHQFTMMDSIPGTQPSVSPVDTAHRPIQAFYFDPNTVGKDSLLKLGLSPKIAAQILAFRAKGGKFRDPEDLGRIYNLPEQDLDRLLPWIRIVGAQGHSAGHKAKLPDLNTADSVELLSVKGIGPVFAGRIVHYRGLLGGFVRKEQLMEVYGLDDPQRYRELAPQLTLTPVPVKKIPINTVTVEELARHPYLRFRQAKALVHYREQHGPYHNLKDLEQVLALEPGQAAKLLPYLIFD